MTKKVTILFTILTVVSVSSLQAACLTLTWTAPGDDEYTGIARQYDIRYSTVPIFADNWDYAYPIERISKPGAAGSQEACLVTGLVRGVRYYFAMRTADEKGNWSLISNNASAVAPDDRCQGSVGNANCDPSGSVDITDVSTIIDHLFLSLRPLCCPDEANIDGDPAGNIDIGDVSSLVYYLFLGASETPPCP